MPPSPISTAWKQLLYVPVKSVLLSFDRERENLSKMLSD